MKMSTVDRTRTRMQQSQQLQQPEGGRFVPDTILPGYQWAPQWVTARTPTVHWGPISGKAVGGPITVQHSSKEQKHGKHRVFFPPSFFSPEFFFIQVFFPRVFSPPSFFSPEFFFPPSFFSPKFFHPSFFHPSLFLVCTIFWNRCSIFRVNRDTRSRPPRSKNHVKKLADIF